MVILAGTNVLNDLSGELYYVQKIVQHEHFDTKAKYVMKNDISLIQIDEEFEFYNLKSIQISTEYISSRREAILSGWGISKPPGRVPDKMEYLIVYTISNTECQVLNPDVEISNQELCTYISRRENGCVADSGSPLISNGKLIGILSWGKFCSNSGPDVFTRITDFTDWIIKNMS